MRPLKETEIRHVDLPVGSLILVPPTNGVEEMFSPECILLRRARPFGYPGKAVAHFKVIASRKKNRLIKSWDSTAGETLRRDLMILEPKDLLLYVNMFVSSEFEAIMKKQPGSEKPE